MAEAAIRKDFLPSEIEAIRRAMAPVEKEAAKARQTAHLRQGSEKPVVETFHDGGKTRDKIGAFAGVSGRTVEKIAAIVEAAEQEPDGGKGWKVSTP